MTYLTRDEIRSACEAVGWEWDGTYFAGSCAWDPGGNLNCPRFAGGVGKGRDDYGVEDAVALLEAWRLRTDENPYRRVLVMLEDPPSVNLAEDDGAGWEERSAFEMDLPTAAVRAVNAWNEKR